MIEYDVQLVVTQSCSIKIRANSEEDLFNQIAQFDNLQIQFNKNPYLSLVNDKDKKIVFKVEHIDIDDLNIKVG